MREVGDVCYADVFKDGTGVVEFATKDGVTQALKKLDDSCFRSHEVLSLVFYFLYIFFIYFVLCLG